MYASTRPILAPTRAQARPVFTREVSAERGVRLPGGSRLQGVTRVSIYLSEDPTYDAKPEAEKVCSSPLAHYFCFLAFVQLKLTSPGQTLKAWKLQVWGAG